jgi:hypothetical protein
LRPASSLTTGGSRPSRQALPIDPRFRERRQEVQRAVGRKRLRTVLGLAVAATAVAGGLAVLHTPLLAARRLTVGGAARSLDPDVLRAAGIRTGEPLIDVEPRASAIRIERLAWVGQATVARSWPSTVDISLTTRSAAGQLPTGPSPTGPVAVVDATGRVLATASAPIRGLPVLLGLGAPATVGSWIADSPGAGAALGTAATLPRSADALLSGAGGGVGAALAVAGALDADHLRPSRVELDADGALTALLGPVTVLFGEPSSLVAKIAALRAVAGAGGLQGATQIDVEVPDRPAVTDGAAGT